MSNEVSEIDEKTLNSAQRMRISELVGQVRDADVHHCIAENHLLRASAELNDYLRSIEKEKP